MRTRRAVLPDAESIHALIAHYSHDGTLLPRTLNEVCENVRDFTVVVDRGRIVGCGALHLYGMHLTEVRRDAFARAGCLSYRELQKLRSGARVKAGGLVADGLRRPPTAKGTSFIRLEDADGLVDVIVPAAVYAECRQALRAVFVVVEGTLQRNGTVISVLARSVAALPA